MEKTTTYISPVDILAGDPSILNIAMLLPCDFTFDSEGRMIGGEYFCRDYALEFADMYVRRCKEEGRCPATNNPSMVRWAIEEVLARWKSILGLYGEEDN